MADSLSSEPETLQKSVVKVELAQESQPQPISNQVKWKGGTNMYMAIGHDTVENPIFLFLAYLVLAIIKFVCLN